MLDKALNDHGQIFILFLSGERRIFVSFYFEYLQGGNLKHINVYLFN